MKTMSLAGPCNSPAMVLVSLGVPQGYPASKQDCKSIYTLLWNLGTQHFLAKDYSACVGAYSAALPYADADAKPRVGRQLALAHLALHQLDRSADTIPVHSMHDSHVQRQPPCMLAPMTLAHATLQHALLLGGVCIAACNMLTGLCRPSKPVPHVRCNLSGQPVSCRSLEALDAAAEYDPSSVYTTFVRIKVLLTQGNAAQALDLLRPLMACEGFNLDFLRVQNTFLHVTHEQHRRCRRPATMAQRAGSPQDARKCTASAASSLCTTAGSCFHQAWDIRAAAQTQTQSMLHLQYAYSVSGPGISLRGDC